MSIELPVAEFVRFGDVLRWSGMCRRSVAKMLRSGCRRVVPAGMKRGLYRRAEVVAAFEGRCASAARGRSRRI